MFTWGSTTRRFLESYNNLLSEDRAMRYIALTSFKLSI